MGTKRQAKRGAELKAAKKPSVSERLDMMAQALYMATQTIESLKQTINDQAIQIEALFRNVPDQDAVLQAINAIQDEVEGFEAVEEGAQEGDLVRVTTTNTTNGATAKHKVYDLGSGTILVEDLEKLLIGKVVGDVVDFEVSDEAEGVEPTVIQCAVDRVSRAITDPEPDEAA